MKNLHQFHKNHPWGSKDFTCVATWLGHWLKDGPAQCMVNTSC